MRRLTRDGTAEPVSRDTGANGDFFFPVQLTTSRICNLTGLIHTVMYSAVSDDHSIHTYYKYISIIAQDPVKYQTHDPVEIRSHLFRTKDPTASTWLPIYNYHCHL